MVLLDVLQSFDELGDGETCDAAAGDDGVTAGVEDCKGIVDRENVSTSVVGSSVEVVAVGIVGSVHESEADECQG